MVNGIDFLISLSQKELWTHGPRGEERREKGRCMETVTWKFTITCEIDGQLEFAVWLGEVNQGLCDRREGGMWREVQERRDMGVPMADSCLWMIENHKIL